MAAGRYADGPGPAAKRQPCEQLLLKSAHIHVPHSVHIRFSCTYIICTTLRLLLYRLLLYILNYGRCNTHFPRRCAAGLHNPRSGYAGGDSTTTDPHRQRQRLVLRRRQRCRIRNDIFVLRDHEIRIRERAKVSQLPARDILVLYSIIPNNTVDIDDK